MTAVPACRLADGRRVLAAGGSHDLCPLQMTALWRAWRVVRKPRLPGCFSMKLTSHLPDDRRAHVEGRLRAT